MKEYNSVVVLGKFMPPHKGHEYMMRFAKQYGKKLYIIVDCSEHQTISPELRKSWIEEEIKDVTVIALKENTPQQVGDHPNFWNVWKTTILNAVESVGGEKPELLIAAMDYGWDLAKTLSCDFVPIDIARESFPISATELRHDVFKHWEYLMDSARPHFMKKICFLGAESTGKSTCAQNIAEHFKTTYVPEYAKAIIKKQNGEFYYSNVEDVAFAQLRTENALAKFTNKIMVCDTDPLTTMEWSKLLFNDCPKSVQELVENQKYDITFLFDNDVPFVDDLHRRLVADPDKNRSVFFKEIKSSLDKYNRPYVVISGTYEERFEKVKEWLNTNYKLNEVYKKDKSEIKNYKP